MRFMQDPRFREARFGACLLGILTLSLLAGCGGGGGGSNGNPGTGTTTTGTAGPTTTGTNSGTQTPLTASVSTPTGLTASLSEASSTVSVNGNLTYTLTLTNSTAAAIPIHTIANPPVLPTTPAAGLVIRNAGGTITFEPVPGVAPVFNGVLNPGQTLTTTVSASGFTAAGTYSAIATFSDDVTPGYGASVGPLTVTAQ